MTKKTSIYWFFIALLIIFHAVNNYLWLRQDCYSTVQDMAYHTRMAIGLRQGLDSLLSSDMSLAEKVKLGSTAFTNTLYVEWPRLSETIAAVACFKSKDFLFCIRFLNLLYFTLLIITVYLTGKKIAGPFSGLLAAYLISFYPAIFGLSRKFATDFPSIALASLIICLLVHEKFQKFWYGVVFGTVLGVAAFISGKFLIAIIGPLLYVILRGVKDNKDNKPHYIINVIVSIALATSIALIWWHQIFTGPGGNWMRLCKAGDFYKVPAYTVSASASRPIPLFYYFGCIYYEASPLFFVLFFIGLFFCIKRWHLHRKEYMILVLSISIPYAVLSFIILPYIAKYQYFFPVMSSVALISVLGLREASAKRNLRRCLTFLIIASICFGLYQFFVISYHCRYPERGPCERFHAPIKNNHRSIINGFHQLIEKIDSGGKKVGIVHSEHFQRSTYYTLENFLRLYDGQYQIYHSTELATKPLTSEGFLENGGRFDFLITFSNFPDIVDFSGLTKFAQLGQEKKIAEATRVFKSFEIIKRDVLQPESVYIFLLKKVK